MTTSAESRLSLCLVMPVLNGEKYLDDALASVRSQNHAPLEFRVRDGGSTDGSLEILRANSHWISSITVQSDTGMYDALANEYRSSSADIYGWLNADDILLQGALQLVELFFRTNPRCEWLTGIPAVADAQGRLAWVAHVAPYYRRGWLARGWYSDIGLGTFQQECTFWRRSLYERVGGLNSALRWGGDLDLWRRFAAAGAEVWQVGTVLAAFRQHETNASAKNRELYLKEAGAKRIIGGKVLGYTYSFARFLIERCRNKQRLRDLLLNSA